VNNVKDHIIVGSGELVDSSRGIWSDRHTVDRSGSDVTIPAGEAVTEQEINRAIQYVTAATSYGRDTVAEILRTGLSELSVLSMQSTRRFEREDLLGYLCQWTMKRTGHPEPLVREVLDGAGRWLDEVATTLAQRDEEAKAGDDDETGAASA
jgi:hypothetical protein